MSRSERIAIAVFCLVAGISIIEASFLGINGSHIMRQADAYGNILGILGAKNFELFDLFSTRYPWGDRAVFDLPIYQYLIATISHLLNKDPLVAVRYVNLFLWLITAFFGFRACESIGYRYSGLFFIGLFASSPLFLHFFSVPLPDNLAIAISVMATSLLLDTNRTLRNFIFAFPLIALASAVKSPVPFIFIVFSAIYLAFSTSGVQDPQTTKKFPQQKLFLFVFLICCLFAAMLLELYRDMLLKGMDPKVTNLWPWYFGSIDMRLSGNFWQVMSERFNQWIPPYYLYAFLAISTLSFLSDRSAKNIKVAMFGAVIAFFSGWLIFSNLYKIHNYYQMPIAIVIFISFSVSTSHLIALLVERKSLPSKALPIFPIVLVVAFLTQTITQDSYGMRLRSDFWKTVEYSLRKDDIFLLVSDRTDIPVIGGRVSTKFFGISPDDFEENCNAYLRQYRSILVESSKSECLKSVKTSATHYISDEGRIFLRAGPSESSQSQ